MRARGIPERLLKLLDKLECVGCVETAPDTFHILLEYAPGNRPTTGRDTWTHEYYEWSPQEEALARRELRQGKITAFYILNAAQSCSCCGDKNPSQRTDWNSTLEINTDGMLAFKSPADLGADPPELQAVPIDRLVDVPPIGTYTKPAKRQAHASCPECEPEASTVNSIADTLDYLWGLKVNLQRGIDITDRAIAVRENEIATLEYKQILSPQSGVEEQVEALNKINAAQAEDLDRDRRKLQEIEAQIKDAEARQNAAMAKLVECQNKKCGAATNAAPAPTPSSAAPCAPGPECKIAAQSPEMQNVAAQINQVVASIRASSSPKRVLMEGEIERLLAALDARSYDEMQSALATMIHDVTDVMIEPGDPAPLSQLKAIRMALYEMQIVTLPAEWQPVARQIYQVEVDTMASYSGKRILLEGGFERLIAYLNAQSPDGVQVELNGLMHDVTSYMIEGGDPAPLKQLKAIKAAVYNLVLPTLPAEWRAVAQQVFELDVAVNSSYSDARVLLEGAIDGLIAGVYAQSFEQIQTNIDALEYDARFLKNSPDLSLVGPLNSLQASVNVLSGKSDLDLLIERIERNIESGDDQLSSAPIAIPTLPPGYSATSNSDGTVTATGPSGKQYRITRDASGGAVVEDLGIQVNYSIGVSPATAPNPPDAQRTAQQMLANPPMCVADAHSEHDVQIRLNCNGQTSAPPTPYTFVVHLDVPVIGLGQMTVVGSGEAPVEATRIDYSTVKWEFPSRSERQTIPLSGDFSIEGIRPSVGGRTNIRITLGGSPWMPVIPGVWTAPVLPGGQIGAPIPFESERSKRVRELGESFTIPGTRDSSGNAPLNPHGDRFAGSVPRLEESACAGSAGTACVAESSCAASATCLDVKRACATTGSAIDCGATLATEATHQLMVTGGPATPPAKTSSVWDRDRVQRWRYAAFDQSRSAAGFGTDGFVLVALRAPTSAGRSVSFVSNGRSTGQAFEVQVRDPSGGMQTVAVAEGLVLEPVRPSAHPSNLAAPSMAAPVDAFCLQFAKSPPDTGMAYRVAGPELQAKYSGVRHILEAGRRLAQGGQLHPDSDPTAYADAIRQYALWVELEHWTMQQFADAFVQRTKENAQALHVNWTQQMQDALRAAAPGRWRDITAVINEADSLRSAAETSASAPHP